MAKKLSKRISTIINRFTGLFPKIKVLILLFFPLTVFVAGVTTPAAFFHEAAFIIDEGFYVDRFLYPRFETPIGAASPYGPFAYNKNLVDEVIYKSTCDTILVDIPYSHGNHYSKLGERDHNQNIVRTGYAIPPFERFYLKFTPEASIVTNPASQLKAFELTYPKFYTKFPLCNKLVSPDVFIEVLETRVVVGPIEVGRLVVECFLRSELYQRLSEEHRFIITHFLQGMWKTPSCATCIIRSSVNDANFEIFFESKFLEEFLEGIADPNQDVYAKEHPNDAEFKLEAGESSKYVYTEFYALAKKHNLDFGRVKEYLDGLEAYNEFFDVKNIAFVKLDELLERGCSAMLKKNHTPEWWAFYRETIEIYILGNGLPGSIAFVVTIYYSFRPNSTFYILGLTAAPIINFVAFFVYVIYVLLS